MDRYNKKSKSGQKSGGWFKQNHGKPGVVYILSNSAFVQGLYKIGCSTRSGSARAADLNNAASTGTPAHFLCIHEVRTIDCGLAEQRVFSVLSKCRVGKPGQEYFQVDLDYAKEVIRRTCEQVDQDCRARADIHPDEPAEPDMAGMARRAPLHVAMAGAGEQTEVTLSPGSSPYTVFSGAGSAATHAPQRRATPGKAFFSGLKLVLLLGIAWFLYSSFLRKEPHREQQPTRVAAERNDAHRGARTGPRPNGQANGNHHAGSESRRPSADAGPGPRFAGLASLLAGKIENFDPVSGTGRIRYPTSLPLQMREEHARYLNMPYQIKVARTQAIDGAGELVFFSSTPFSPDQEKFDCHACHPILSAMLVEEANGRAARTLLPLQPLGVHGGWGQIVLDGNRAPAVVVLGPGKRGFVIKDNQMAQGYRVEWATLYSIEANGFKRVADYLVRSGGDDPSLCGDRQESCAKKETHANFEKSSVHRGYYDLSIIEDTVEQRAGRAVRSLRSYRLCFNGAEYSEEACY